MKFLDTNVILFFLTGDDEEKAEACYRLFERVRGGGEQLYTSEVIVAEVTYVLSSSRQPYGLSHEEIRGRLLPILELRGLRMSQKQVCLDALDLYAAHPRLDFEDALAVAHMGQRGIGEIASYDRDFDGVEGVERWEPA